MKSNKLHILIIALFAIFWLIFIAWGFFKSSRKLTSPGKPIPINATQPVTAPKPAGGTQALTTAAVTDKIKTFLGIKTDKKEAEKPAEEPRPTSIEPSAILVRAFVVAAKDFQDTLPVMGTVKAKKEIPLKFEVNGVIQKIYFREGERIRQGDIVVDLDPRDMQYRLRYAKSKFESTKAAAAAAQKRLEVHQKLYEAGAIIKSKFEEVQLEAESARYQIETARAEMELAENEARKISLASPVDGVMGPRDAEEGEFVTPQDKVVSIYEINEVNVEVGIVERDIDKVKLGQKTKVYVDAHPGVTFAGTVDKINPVVEGKSRTLTAKIKVENAGGMLLPGMFSRADIEIIELPNAIIVPTTCLIAAGKDIVLAPVIPPATVRKTEDEAETGTVSLRQVAVGYRTGDYAQITDGLSVNDMVVLEAQGELKDNAKVKIIGKEELSF
ncbi:MAG: efflux RND transporter periplasmic adaptor subunit [Candidatus Omnitrophica bacterium]|nr:efflux RND transporter periplasmic adaptor subunit [Candidatus Omnitrophota bacterium]